MEEVTYNQSFQNVEMWHLEVGGYAGRKGADWAQTAVKIVDILVS